METFRSRVRKVVIVLYHCGLLVLAAATLALLHLSVGLQRFLRNVIPLILDALPPEYRRLFGNAD